LHGSAVKRHQQKNLPSRNLCRESRPHVEKDGGKQERLIERRLAGETSEKKNNKRKKRYKSVKVKSAWKSHKFEG